MGWNAWACRKLCRVAGMVGLAAALGAAGCGDRSAATPGPVGPGGVDSGGVGATPDAGPPVDPSVDGQLTINELMPDNVLTLRDDRGAASPWIEIYNPTGQDIALGGYGITDDFTAPGKAILPAGVVAPAGGHLLLWADGNASAGPAHLGVLLSHAGRVTRLGAPGRIVHRSSDLRRAGDRHLRRARAGWFGELGQRVERLARRGEPERRGAAVSAAGGRRSARGGARGRRHERSRARLRPHSAVRPGDLRRQHRLAARGARHLGAGHRWSTRGAPTVRSA